MAATKLTQVVQLRLSPADKRLLRRVAKHYDRKPSEMLRRLLHDAAAKLEPVPNATEKES